MLLTTDRKSKGYITTSEERIPDFGGSRLNCTDELDVNRSITGRYTDLRKDLGKCFTSVSQKKAMLVVEHRPTRWCD